MFTVILTGSCVCRRWCIRFKPVFIVILPQQRIDNASTSSSYRGWRRRRACGTAVFALELLHRQDRFAAT